MTDDQRQDNVIAPSLILPLCVMLAPLFFRHVSIHFDLNEHARVDQAGDLDHRSCRADGTEDLAVCAADGFPVPAYVDDEHAGADHVL